MNNGMKRNTIIFGNDDSSNIKRIDELIEKMSKESSKAVEVEGTKDVKRAAIYFGERNVSFSAPVNDNIRKIDALIEIKKKESNYIDDLESRKVIKKNTVMFDESVSKDESEDSFRKKYVKRGKINIKNELGDDEDSELVISEPQPLKVDSILGSDEVDEMDNKVVSNVKNKDKNISLLLVIIIMLLVLVLVGVFLVLYFVS